MKIFYDPETDSLMMTFCDKPSVESEEVAPGFVLDFDAEGNVVGIDVEYASKHFDLTTLEATSLPFLHSLKVS